MTHPDDESNPRIIHSIYDAAPGHPLMPFALALVEPDEDRRRFFVSLGTKRIDQDPASGETATGLRVSSAAFEKIGDYEMAKPLYRKAYEDALASLGETHPDTQTLKANWERCRETLKQTPAANPPPLDLKRD